MTNIGRGEISNFILSNRNFLELAFDVEEAMLGGQSKTKLDNSEGVRVLLIKAVLDALEDHVRSQLDGGWEIKVSPRAKWGEMTIRRSEWPKLRNAANGPPVPAAVRLANNIGNWEQVYIGFVSHRFEFPEPDRTRLTAALLPVMMPGAQATDLWAAMELPSSPFRNWWDKGFLIDVACPAYRARTDASAVQPREIKELGDHLVGIAQAAAKAVPVGWSAQPPGAD